MLTKTSTTNDLLWFLLNQVLLRHGAATMFVMLAWFKWGLPGFVILLFSAAWLVLFTYAHQRWGHIIAYYMLCLYHFDRFFCIRMLKIAVYSVLYIWIARPRKLDLMRVYIPVAHSLTGIIHAKLYDYRTRSLVMEFMVPVIPVFYDVLRTGQAMADGTPFFERYTSPLLYAVVIIVGIISLAIPRVVPPRGREARVPAASPPQVGAVDDAASTAATAAAAGATSAATAVVAFDVATAADIAAAASDDAGIAAAVVAAATASATPTAAAAEPGQWTICSLLKGWWAGIKQEWKDIKTSDKWVAWANPGGLQFYEDFYKLE